MLFFIKTRLIINIITLLSSKKIIMKYKIFDFLIESLVTHAKFLLYYEFRKIKNFIKLYCLKLYVFRIIYFKKMINKNFILQIIIFKNFLIINFDKL